MAIVLSHQWHTARKRHVCDSCCGRIDPGADYYRCFVADGGESWTWKAHAECHRAGQILAAMGIEHPDFPGAYLNVSDMDREDRDLIRKNDPATANAIWGVVDA